MTRLPKILTAASLALMVGLVGCASDDVSASAETDGELITEAELTCCEQAEADGNDCGECPEGGAKVCPVTGATEGEHEGDDADS